MSEENTQEQGAQEAQAHAAEVSGQITDAVTQAPEASDTEVVTLRVDEAVSTTISNLSPEATTAVLQVAATGLQFGVDALAEAQAKNKALTTALENCRLYAAKRPKEEWARNVLRFCEEAGVTGSPLRG